MLRVVVSDRLERLAEGLADELRRNPLRDPFAPEIVVVQNRGMERWLAMRLAERLGIWSRGEHPFPKALLWRLARRMGLVPEPDPYEPDTVQWALMDLLPRCGGEPAGYLADDPDGRKLVHLAGSVAGRFDQYAVHRAEVLEDWERGGGGRDEWQAGLWRTLVERLGPRHPARVLDDLIGRFAGARKAPVELPPRIAVFGVSALPPRYLEAFAAIARFTDVTFHAVNPCREMWFEISSPRAADRLRERERRAGLAPGALHAEEGPPLLAVNGTVARDFLGALYDATDSNVDEAFDEDPGGGGAVPALRRLQADVRAFRVPPPEEERAGLAPGDDSLQVHVCHSPLREIEVLHDRLLSLFEARPGMAPREIAVMAPDIEIYAAHIESVFGSAEPRIPYSIADRSPVRTGHVADVVRRLLRLPDGDAGASELLDLLACPPVLRRFGLDESALGTIRGWVGEAGIRRGFGEPGGAPSTWAFGLDRLVLGSAVDAAPLELVAGILPVDAGDADTLEALCRFADAATACASALRGPMKPAEWAEALRRESARFVEAVPDEAAEWSEIRAAFAAPAEAAALAGYDARLSLPALRDVLEGALERSALASPFLGGGVTFCNLIPMRSIPFRVLCLIGMNDESFPRQDIAPGFDLLRRSTQRGDRSRRMDDRHLFLECLTAAREVLHISHVGRDIRTDASRPPSVCVSELLEVIDRTFAVPGAPKASAREALTVHHRLQPFSPDYFLPNGGGLFSYSVRHCAGGRALAAGPVAAPSARAAPEPAAEELNVTLDEFLRFFRNPAEGMVRVRFGARYARHRDGPDDLEPLLPSDSEAGALLEQVVGARLDGRADLPLPADLLRAAGAIPDGPAGEVAVAAFAADADLLYARLAPRFGAAELPPAAWSHTAHGVTLEARLDDLRADGQLIWKAGGLYVQDRIDAWIRHLILLAAAPAGCAPRTALVCGGETKDIMYGPVADAGRLLDDWLGAFREGLTAPLPFWPDCSYQWVRPRRNSSAADDARAQWSNERGSGARDRSPLLQSLYPADEDILTDEFTRWAERLLRPMVEAAGRGEGA